MTNSPVKVSSCMRDNRFLIPQKHCCACSGSVHFKMRELSRHIVGTCLGYELRSNLSGNAHLQLYHLAEPLWTDSLRRGVMHLCIQDDLYFSKRCRKGIIYSTSPPPHPPPPILTHLEKKPHQTFQTHINIPQCFKSCTIKQNTVSAVWQCNRFMSKNLSPRLKE